MTNYGINKVGNGSIISEDVILGFPSKERLFHKDYPGARIGENSVIRSGTVIYCDVETGANFSTGHNVLVREKTRIGDDVSLGSSSVVEGNCTIGNGTNIQSMVFLPWGINIGSEVFIGPNTVFTNDLYPPGRKDEPDFPEIKDGASIGANSTILPGITIGIRSVVAAGAVVTEDVPDEMLAMGMPAKIKDLPGVYRRRLK